MGERLEKNEALVLEEKQKRSSFADELQESLVSLNDFLENDLKNSEEGSSVTAKAELGG